MDSAQNNAAKQGASRALDVLYLLAGVLLIPYFIYRRLIKGKRSAGWRNKLAYTVPKKSGDAPRVWIHAVSVGEALAAEPLIKALQQQFPKLELVISTTTTTGQETAVKRYGAERVCFYPIDLSSAVRRALDRVKPDAIVLLELEVWPNFTAEAAFRGIPIYVVNGRVTERAAARYKKFWWLVGNSFHRVGRWLVQTDEYAQRLKDLGVAAEKIEIAGNIKYDAIDTAPLDRAEKFELRRALQLPDTARVLIGGSTHPTEEATLLKSYAALRQANPHLRLILVPRHPERINAVVADVQAAGFAPVRYSAIKSGGIDAALAELPPAARESWVLVVDTVGDLKRMYKLADIAFIGGSLIPHGGQNIMEPCGLGIAAVHGPHMHNFNEALEILRGCNGAVQVSTETLTAELQQLLNDPKAAAAMAARARDAFLQKQGATARAVQLIGAALPEPIPLTPAPSAPHSHAES